MNVGITPVPMSIGVTIHAGHQPRDEKAAGKAPVLPAADANNGNLNNNNQRNADEKPRPLDRPPGTDPSTTPQSLFDASLIASEYKANAVIEELAVEKEEQAETNRSERIAQGTEEIDSAHE